eukprot:GHVP01035241.1.p1 GENE.GHVP01035241.1~~GHVP01035241.1.p1  ORF type:complete len:175 (-),score=21.39 GHVP01035241.1:286-762(-)
MEPESEEEYRWQHLDFKRNISTCFQDQKLQIFWKQFRTTIKKKLLLRIRRLLAHLLPLEQQFLCLYQLFYKGNLEEIEEIFSKELTKIIITNSQKRVSRENSNLDKTGESTKQSTMLRCPLHYLKSLAWKMMCYTPTPNLTRHINLHKSFSFSMTHSC